MLIRFEVSNYRSIAAPTELSMVAIDRDRPEARDQPMLGESLLRVAAVFGPNASGKSNIIAAFTWVRDAVQHSLRMWDDEIPIEPFAFGAGPSKPSEFVIESIIGGIRFEYVLEIDSEKVMLNARWHCRSRVGSMSHWSPVSHVTSCALKLWDSSRVVHVASGSSAAE